MISLMVLHWGEIKQEIDVSGGEVQSGIVTQVEAGSSLEEKRGSGITKSVKGSGGTKSVFGRGGTS